MVQQCISPDRYWRQRNKAPICASPVCFHENHPFEETEMRVLLESYDSYRTKEIPTRSMYTHAQSDRLKQWGLLFGGGQLWHLQCFEDLLAETKGFIHDDKLVRPEVEPSVLGRYAARSF